jgi:hypothetical protein
MEHGVVLIVLRDEFETKDGPICSEEKEYEMAIVTDYDISEFK